MAFEQRLLISTLVTIALSVSQAWADPVLDQLLACRHVPDSATRLECFDHASDAASTVRQPEATPHPSKPADVESSILRISKPVAGRVDFTLQNGQVWQQMDAEDARSAKIGDRIAVSKTFLGAYWLKIEGGRKWRVILVR
jgi:hypothetical protein